MYNPKSMKAEEFISHEEIESTLLYADENKNICVRTHSTQTHTLLIPTYGKGKKHIEEINILNVYMPEMMTEDEITSVVMDAINEVNATSVKDMKVGDITLVKVKNGKIDKYIVDYAKMQKELGIKEK